MTSIKKKLFTVSYFAIAMGFLESAVVVYLRALYYPEGFSFPLKTLDSTLAVTELLREAATVFMLIGIGILAGKTKLQRFAFFCLAFAIWDLFYYVFLYLLLGWPNSLGTWDLLFLLPSPWIGPVWAPCLISVLMLIGSLFGILRIEKDASFKLKIHDWVLLVVGAFLSILSFMIDFLFFNGRNGIPTEEALANYQPEHFSQVLFWIGFVPMLFVVSKHVFFNPSTSIHHEIQ